MSKLGRLVLFGILLGAAAVVLSIPAPPIQADDDAPVVVNLAPKNCKQPGTLIDPRFSRLGPFNVDRSLLLEYT